MSVCDEDCLEARAASCAAVTKRDVRGSSGPGSMAIQAPPPPSTM